LVLLFQTIGPFLLFSPFFTSSIRTVTAFIFMLMHVGFGTFLYLNFFPAISIVAMILFLPTAFWDRWLPERAAGPRPVQTAAPLFANIIAACCLVFILGWLSAPPKVKKSEPFRSLASFLFIKQRWQMFGPNPPRSDGWLVVPGMLRDGSIIDLYRDGSPPKWEKPRPEKMAKNVCWRKYLINLVIFASMDVAENYARYSCASWNAGHKDAQALESVEIDVMTRPTSAQDPQPDYTKRPVLKYDCAGNTVTFKASSLDYMTFNEETDKGLREH